MTQSCGGGRCNGTCLEGKGRIEIEGEPHELEPGQSIVIPAFTKEIGLPTTFAELGILADTDLRAVANSTTVVPGCPKQLDTSEIYQILLECR